jgi:hypothetical protein
VKFGELESLDQHKIDPSHQGREGVSALYNMKRIMVIFTQKYKTSTVQKAKGQIGKITKRRVKKTVVQSKEQCRSFRGY